MTEVVELIDQAVALPPGPQLSAALAGLAWDPDTDHGTRLELRILWRPGRDPDPPPPPAPDDQEEPPF